MNYEETLNYIHSLGNFSKPATLERIKSILQKLGNPQNNFKAIHIAGTNGKGSVSAMLSKIFSLAGYKTALFISPFIIDFCERIQINGEFIFHNDICKYAEIVKSANTELTEFEFITAVAFLYFSQQNCDIAIIETGLGGRLDATNTLGNVIANVITKIGLDHTTVLGNTIEKITAEKCGIIKNCPVITLHTQPDGAFKVLNAYKPIIPNANQLKVLQSDINGNTFTYKSKEYKTSLVGEYQIENALAVIETIENCGIEIPYGIIYKALSETYFPARMEVIAKKPLVILDGAHNPDGANALGNTLKKYNGKVTAIIGMMKDKDCKEVLKRTMPYCKKAIAVEVENLPRAMKKEELKDLAINYCNTVTAENYDEAIKTASNDEVIFVFGSLYLASGIREKLKNFFT
ncbi:MAG: folylpolyglutamate synthase/dihydrofolate synthase family protein [Acutalibacteraceae bacterium]|nr:folylpolyglutamate synthase/dihydrofolate synthase family protein [Acutalibacteraceae bacterium]